MTNRILAIGMLALLFSCAQAPKITKVDEAPRLPSSQETTMIKQCGEIQYSEDKYTARDKDDVMFSVLLDCNRDRTISAEEGRLVIGIPLAHVKPQQKSWLTRWKRAAVSANNIASANPYVCVTVEATEDPCVTGRSVYGTKPKFVGSVFNIQNPAKKGK